MGVVTRIDPIDRDVFLSLDEGLGPEGRSRALAAFARQELERAETVNRQASGQVPTHARFVDGMAGAPIETVRPDGVIVFDFDLANHVLDWIGEELARESPVRTGRYANSHALFTEGGEVHPASGLPRSGTFVFLNTQPYARKIERGYSDQAPDGVYQGVAAVAKGRFGNIAAIKFSYRSFQEGQMVAYKGVGEQATATRGAKGRFTGSVSTRSAEELAAARLESQNRQPAIIVRIY